MRHLSYCDSLHHQEGYKTLDIKFEVSKAFKIHTVDLWVMILCSQVQGTTISKKYTPIFRIRSEI